MIGLALAAIGVPLFFGETFQQEMIGLGLITVGVGVSMLTVLAVAGKADLAEARTSKRSALASLILVPHIAWLWVIALGLVAFGVAMLLIAIGAI